MEAISDYTPEEIAEWLYQHSKQFDHWINTQRRIQAMFVRIGDHQRALEYLNRASEICEHLKAMGAVHLLH
jgi:hypothetical protein